MASKPIGAALSHAGVQVIFTNHSRASCRLYGYPGVAAVNKNGKQFEQAKRTTNGYLAGPDHGKPYDIPMQPGEKASSVIEGTSVAPGTANCTSGRAFLVTPPNTKRSTRIPFRDYFCNLEVHPTIAGTKR